MIISKFSSHPHCQATSLVRLIAAGAILVVVGGCMPEAKVIETFAPSPQAKLLIRESLRTGLSDPYSIRSGAISNSWRTDRNLALVGDHEIVCVQFNSKNKFGAYSGLATNAYYYVIVGGKIRLIEYEWSNCRDPARVKTWMPFPEIMNIT